MSATATPAELREALGINATKFSSESAQAGSIVRALAALGYRKHPDVQSGKLDGDTCRLYVWKDSPAGDVVLVTGPAFNPLVCDLADLKATEKGVYIRASTDRTKAAGRAAHTADAWKPPAIRTPKAKAAVVRAVAKVVTAERPAPPPKVQSQAAADRDELRSALAAILG